MVTIALDSKNGMKYTIGYMDICGAERGGGVIIMIMYLIKKVLEL